MLYGFVCFVCFKYYFSCYIQKQMFRNHHAMIIVSVAFVICWSPVNIFFLMADSVSQLSSDQVFALYYSTLFLSYLYICMNPFIYAMKHEGVKEELARLAVWRQRVGVTTSAGDAAASDDNRRNFAGGTRSSRTGTAPQ